MTERKAVARRPSEPAGRAALHDACRHITSASGQLSHVAHALVEQAALLTRASGAAMYEMRGAQWAMVASAGTDVWPSSLALPSGQVPPGPLLIDSARDHAHDLARAAVRVGAESLVVVPLHLWPSGPALVCLQAGVPGALSWADIDLTAVLSVTAGAAAYASPGGRSSQSAALEELGWHQQLLEGIARGTPLRESVRRVCVEVEARFPGTRCSVLLAEREKGRLRHVAGPSLPAAFNEAIDGLSIGDGVGACGTAAATLRPAVIEDTYHDARAASFADLAKVHDLRSVWSYPLVDAKGRIAGTFALYRQHVHTPDAEEIATVASLASVATLAIEQAHSAAALKRAAWRDPLTGLPNRRAFNRLLARALDSAKAHGTSCAVIFMDLDGFKLINDSLGHEAGDQVLVEVAQRLNRTMGRLSTVARFGGDEFTVLIEDTTAAGAERCADRLSAALAAPFVVEGGTFVVTAALGIAVADPEQIEPANLIRDADAAMYAAKGQGRGRRSMFDREVRERILARIRLEHELRRAVSERTLEVHFQPVVDLATGRWCCVEALARWRHPSLGDVPPDQFVGLAEEIGVVGDLGRHVLDRALRQVKVWESSGSVIPVAVNISPTQLADRAVMNEIFAAVETAGVAAELLHLEITETALMENDDEARNILRGLREAGITAVIDDFGTGYSSIGRLSQLPVAGLKIDKSFVASLTDDTAATNVVRAVIQLAHSFSLRVVAEGVETREQLELLRRLGCDCAQGYLFARPADGATISDVLATPPALDGD